jgi:hypothetical protein
MKDINSRVEYKEYQPTLYSECCIQADKEGRIMLISDVRDSTADLSSDTIGNNPKYVDTGTYLKLHKDFSEISCNSLDGFGVLGIRSKLCVQRTEEVHRIEVVWQPLPGEERYNINPDEYIVEGGERAAPGTLSLVSDLYASYCRKAYAKADERLSLEVGGGGSTGIYMRSEAVGTPKITISVGPDIGFEAGNPENMKSMIEECLKRTQESPVGELELKADTIRFNCTHLFRGDTPFEVRQHLQTSGPVSTAAKLVPAIGSALGVAGEFINTFLYLFGVRIPTKK